MPFFTTFDIFYFLDGYCRLNFATVQVILAISETVIVPIILLLNSST